MITLLENDFYSLKAEAKDTTYFMHFDYKLPVFNKTIYKLLLSQWVLVLEEFKKDGIEDIQSIIPVEETKIQKFQGMFGLEEYNRNESYSFYKRVL